MSSGVKESGAIMPMRKVFIEVNITSEFFFGGKSMGNVKSPEWCRIIMISLAESNININLLYFFENFNLTKVMTTFVNHF